MTTIAWRIPYASDRKSEVDWFLPGIFVFYAICLAALLLSSGGSAQGGDVFLLGP